MRSPVIWSVHDVTPESFRRAERIVARLASAGARDVSILVVPSGEWSADALHTLRAWDQAGYVLAAHGWTHRSIAPKGVYHRLHSAFFSRGVAEHLGRPAGELLQLVRWGERWFGEAGLSAPRLYVPPAWALGDLPLRAFGETSFRWVETLTGIYDVREARFRRLPLVGFEADTALRAMALRASNRVNAALATRTRRPLRVAIHPGDFELALASDLARLIAARPESASPGG